MAMATTPWLPRWHPHLNQGVAVRVEKSQARCALAPGVATELGEPGAPGGHGRGDGVMDQPRVKQGYAWKEGGW